MFRFWSSAILNLELPSLFGISRQQKESKNRSKAQLKVTALHNKIKQKREAYQWWVANKLIKKYDAVAAEDLPIENDETVPAY